MPARRPSYKQLALPYDTNELYQRVRPALPPGLRELAEAEKLDDSTVLQLTQMWRTIRGKQPTSLAEWRVLYGEIKSYL